jgi:hypothetical protein
MQHLLTMFYALIFSFGHSAAPRPVEAPQVEAVNVATYAPTRQELARERFDNSYAESACVSCRPMNVSYRVR